MIPYRLANLEKLRPDTTYRKNHKYYEVPAALDVETTRTGTDPAKDFAFVYLWALAIGDYVVYGRTPEELAEFIPILKAELRLTVDFRLVVYVHFLKYDFSFLKKYLLIENENFIARSAHEPLRVLCEGCMELRDSYTYTEQSLELMGKEIGLHKVENFDYSEIRTPETKLTADELRYQETDVLILTRYYERESNFYGGLSRVPLTATMRVQRVISAELDRYSDAIKWRVYAQQLDPRKQEDRMVLNLLHIAFFGGFNYCNQLYEGTTIKQAYGVDIDTSYGSQCLFHRFPRSRFKPLPTMPGGLVPPGMLDDILQGKGLFKDKALLLVCEFDDLEARIPELAFLPIYCKNYLYRTLDRKRSMKAKHLTQCEHVETCLTDVDFRTVAKLYTWRDIKIHAILGSRYDPLPEYVVQAIVDMIAQKKATKAELKEVKKYRRITEEENAEYHRIKSMVSRIYGLFVKDPLRMDYEFDKTTGCIVSTGIHGLNEEDGKKKKFAPVLYQWGVWVSAWARAEIMSVLLDIAAIGGKEKNGIAYNRKVLYSDTDCLVWFGLGAEAFAIVERYNKKKRAQLDTFCKRRKIGKEWLLGLGELDLTTYSHFRAVGMKQYAEVQIIDGKPEFDYHISGLPRMDWRDKDDGTKENKGCTYFDKWTDPADKIEQLTPELLVPAEESHLKGTFFIDEERECCITDRDGNCMHISAKSCIMLIPREFKLKQSIIERLKTTDPDALRVSAKRNFAGVI